MRPNKQLYTRRKQASLATTLFMLVAAAQKTQGLQNVGYHSEFVDVVKECMFQQLVCSTPTFRNDNLLEGADLSSARIRGERYDGTKYFLGSCIEGRHHPFAVWNQRQNLKKHKAKRLVCDRLVGQSRQGLVDLRFFYDKKELRAQYEKTVRTKKAEIEWVPGKSSQTQEGGCEIGKDSACKSDIFVAKAVSQSGVSPSA